MQKAILSGAAPSAIYSPEYAASKKVRESVVKRFFAWSAGQENNHFLWLAISLFGLIGMLLPVTAIAILFAGGNNLLLWIIACAFNVPVLVLNLAAQPSRIILPALVLATIVDAIVIISSLIILVG